MENNKRKQKNTKFDKKTLNAVIKKTKRVLKLALISTLVAAGLSSCNFTGNVNHAPLHSQAEVMSFVEKNNIEDSYIDLVGVESNFLQHMLYDNKITRLKIQNGMPYTIYLDSKMTEKQKSIIKDRVDMINYIFTEINPAYKFVVKNGQKDPLDNYAVNVSFINFSNRPALGMTTGGLTPSLGDLDAVSHNLYLSVNIADDEAQIKSVFTHEFMHVLGVGDQYINDSDFYNTIMGGRSQLTKNDIYLLYALYSPANTAYSIERANEIYYNFATKYDEDFVLKQKAAELLKSTLTPEFVKNKFGGEGFVETKLENTYYKKSNSETAYSSENNQLTVGLSSYVSLYKFDTTSLHTNSITIKSFSPKTYGSKNCDRFERFNDFISVGTSSSFYFVYNNILYQASYKENDQSFKFTEIANQISQAEHNKINSKIDETKLKFEENVDNSNFFAKHIFSGLKAADIQNFIKNANKSSIKNVFENVDLNSPDKITDNSTYTFGNKTYKFSGNKLTINDGTSTYQVRAQFHQNLCLAEDFLYVRYDDKMLRVKIKYDLSEDKVYLYSTHCEALTSTTNKTTAESSDSKNNDVAYAFV